MEKRYLEFEKPIRELEQEISHLEVRKKTDNVDNQTKTIQLKQTLKEKTKEIYSSLTPWQTVQVARHPQRPHTLEYINSLFGNFYPLHGDRIHSDDPAIIAGIGKFKTWTVAVVGHLKGNNTEENIARNFGMAHPEGYRKALRVMKLAEKFRFPVITLIDTPGAHPHLEAEERNQALAIATNLEEMAMLKTPTIAIIIGEGGSGGALGIGVTDRILMMEFAIYSVISPEGCASILWKDQKAAGEAAASLKIVSRDLLRLGLIDEIIPEPAGGAHNQPEEAIKILDSCLEKNMETITAIPLDELVTARYQKYRKIGVVLTEEPEEEEE